MSQTITDSIVMLDMTFELGEMKCDSEECCNAAEIAVQIWCGCVYPWCMPCRNHRKDECDHYDPAWGLGWNCDMCGRTTNFTAWSDVVQKEWPI